MRTSKIILVAFLYLIASLYKPLCSLVWYIICPEGLIFWMISCGVTRSVWVRGVLLRDKTLTLRDTLSCWCVGKAVLLFHALTALSWCRSHNTGIAFSSWGWLVMHCGQNILTPQSRHMVQPAKSHTLSVWPKISQSLEPVIEKGVAEVRGVACRFLRRRGAFSFHKVCCMWSAFLDTVVLTCLNSS